MKKGKYIDIYVIMACLSHKKSAQNQQLVDTLINKAFDAEQNELSDKAGIKQFLRTNHLSAELQN
jgi:hypothetical protein